MSDLVGNPVDWFPPLAAHLLKLHRITKLGHKELVFTLD